MDAFTGGAPTTALYDIKVALEMLHAKFFEYVCPCAAEVGQLTHDSSGCYPSQCKPALANTVKC